MQECETSPLGQLNSTINPRKQLKYKNNSLITPIDKNKKRDQLKKRNKGIIESKEGEIGDNSMRFTNYISKLEDSATGELNLFISIENSNFSPGNVEESKRNKTKGISKIGLK